MTEPDTTTSGSATDQDPPASGATPGPHHDHVRTDAEVQVDDQLGTGDNVH